MEYQPLKAETFRQPDWPVESLFLRRWSPRAMNAEPLTEGELHRLFEAARWAPSSYNEQEWRFLFAERIRDDWHLFFDLLMEANQVWCRNAAALIVVVSKRTFTRNGKPNSVHSFDTGLATQNLLLQATAMNLVAHAMAGFDRDAARRDLEVPDDFSVECMIAVGRPGDPKYLPDHLREAEIPSGRKPVDAIAQPGKFRFA